MRKPMLSDLGTGIGTGALIFFVLFFIWMGLFVMGELR